MRNKPQEKEKRKWEKNSTKASLMYVIPPTTSTAMIVKMDCITQKMRSLAGKKMKKPRGVKCNYNDRFK